MALALSYRCICSIYTSEVCLYLETTRKRQARHSAWLWLMGPVLVLYFLLSDFLIFQQRTCVTCEGQSPSEGDFLALGERQSW